MKTSKGTTEKMKPFIYSKMLFNEEIEDMLCKIQGLSGFVFIASLLLNIVISSMGIKTHCKGFSDLFQYFREQQPLLEVAIIGGSAIIHVMTSIVRLVRRKHMKRAECNANNNGDNECQIKDLVKTPVTTQNVHRMTGYVLMVILTVAILTEQPNPDGVDSNTFLFRYLLPSLIFTFAGLYHYTFGLIKVFRFVSTELPKSHLATLLGIAATLGFLKLFHKLLGPSIFQHDHSFSTGRSYDH